MEDVWVYLGLSLTAFLSATILPGSSEALLTALLIERQDEALALFATATAGNTAGAAVNWVLGRFLSRCAGRNWFSVSPTWLARTAGWFTRYGWGLLLFSWVPIIGDPVTVAAGLLRMRFLPFLLLVALGKAARYAAVIGAFAAFRSWLEF